MGLDLTVSLTTGSNDFNFIKNELINIEDLFLNKSSYCKYYRLNWSGVGIERNFSNFILNLIQKTRNEKLEHSFTLREVKNNPKKLFVVTGYEESKYGKRFIETIESGKSIRKGKGNTLKLKKQGYSRKDVFLNKFKIYEFNGFITDIYSSVLDIICLGKWAGSNGESYSLEHSEKGISVFEFNYEEIENSENPEEPEWTEIKNEIYVLEDINLFKESIEKNIQALEFVLKSDNHSWNYIASNNLTLLLMTKEFIESKDATLVSYFG
jgi:hypothetical protein